MHFHFGPSSDDVPSSPPPGALASSPASVFLSPTRSSRRKERRNPSVTPRRFGRFFTPRSSLFTTDRRPLSSLGESSVNMRPVSPRSITTDALDSDPILCSSPTERLGRTENDGSKRRIPGSSQSPLKRRRGLTLGDMPLPRLNIPTTPVAESARSSLDDPMDGLGDRRRATLNLFFRASRSGLRDLSAKSTPIGTDPISASRRASQALEGYQPVPIRKLRNRGFEAQLLNREHGYSLINGQQHMAFPAADTRSITASFCSGNFDTVTCEAYSGQGNTIPFSLASATGTPITAIGDEEGYVRFLDTSSTQDIDQPKVRGHHKFHDNAIMDLAFSNQNHLLATACGDRTSKIIDMGTTTVAAELAGGHNDSLRQVAFQPGQALGLSLATSDRAGRIQIWDLRCSRMPINTFSSTGPLGDICPRDTTLDVLYGKTVNTIDNAHERNVHGSKSAASVTTIHWLPEGREHLLLSASEANATIKLWDTRYIKPRRQVDETPLAITLEPRSHTWRSYGITSLALSSDSARLYAACKDSTVYAYSTAHLMLGHAPALEDGAIKRKPHAEEGLGPLYGFKHDMLSVQSFYVKCAIRPATDSSPELLAVGSSNSCAVLFPTDERYMRSSWAKTAHIPSGSSSVFGTAPPPPTPGTPSLNTSLSFTCTTPGASNSSSNPMIPISRTGTALIRGHSREVTTVSWGHNGKLITASDDCYVRHWQEDDVKARHLRTVGEFGGERHMAGWADVASDWDVTDDEE